MKFVHCCVPLSTRNGEMLQVRKYFFYRNFFPLQVGHIQTQSWPCREIQVKIVVTPLLTLTISMISFFPHSNSLFVFSLFYSGQCPLIFILSFSPFSIISIIILFFPFPSLIFFDNFLYFSSHKSFPVPPFTPVHIHINVDKIKVS